MKHYWQKLAAKIDARTLRERVIIFAMAALVLIALFNTALLDPQYAKQKQLSQRVTQERSQIASMQAEIQQKMAAHRIDPDKENLARLQQLKQQFGQMQTKLQDMQKVLVAPEKMSSLLEDILKQNGKLRLVSLKTLPASSVGELVLEDKKTAENGVQHSSRVAKENVDSKPATSESIYRHGVEIVVQGSYLDILDYLARLETMPWQLFWGKAKLDAGEYPRATLTLTLYTLSLDRKWLNI